jgi:ABC-type dipeptide/oligopeptide/nickel transport system ATPase component
MGMSLLFISHDLALVARFADRLAIMHEGKIVEVGETAEILARPAHPQTLRLLEAAQRFNQDSFSMKGLGHTRAANAYENNYPQLIDEPNG